MSRLTKTQIHKNCQTLVGLFCKGDIDWAKEVKIAKQLLSVWPDIDFWRRITSKASSLSWFLTEDGENYLKQQEKQTNLKLTPNKGYKIGNAIYDIPTNFIKKQNKSPKSILEFVMKTEYGKN